MLTFSKKKLEDEELMFFFCFSTKICNNFHSESFTSSPIFFVKKIFFAPTGAAHCTNFDPDPPFLPVMNSNQSEKMTSIQWRSQGESKGSELPCAT